MCMSLWVFALIAFGFFGILGLFLGLFMDFGVGFKSVGSHKVFYGVLGYLQGFL